MFFSGCALGGHKSKVHSVKGKKQYRKKDYKLMNNEERVDRKCFLRKIKKAKKGSK